MCGLLQCTAIFLLYLQFRVLISVCIWPILSVVSSLNFPQADSYQTVSCRLLVTYLYIIMSASCPVCVKGVLDTEEGLGCDAECERWFHRECVKVSKSEYQRFSNDNSIKWYCHRTDCKKTVADPIDAKLDAILSKLSSLATKTELSEGLQLIKQDLELVTSKLQELEPRLAYVESEISTIKDKQVAGSDQLFEDVLSECNDRNRRAKNVIVYNIPDSNTTSKTADAVLVRDFLAHLKSNVQYSDVRHFRLGKKRTNRPLMLCMPSEATAIHIFKNFKENDVPISMRGISISHDRTLRERRHLETLRATLKSKQDAGDTSLTIRYKNGTPSIVPKNE